MAFENNILGNQGDIDLSIFADVAFSGDFNDLINIPSFFNPGLQEVTDVNAITTNSITVGGLIAGNLFTDGYSFGISDNLDGNYNLSYIPYVGLILDDFAGNQSILNPFGLQLNSGTLSYIGPSVAWSLPASSGTIALLSDITIGTTPTLQEVTTEGNITDQELRVNANDVSSYVDEADETQGYAKLNQGYVAIKAPFIGGGEALIGASNIGAGVNATFELPNKPSGSYNLATEDQIPTTATEVDALKRNGSNANSDVDIDTYSLKAKSVFMGGANKMEVKSENLLDNHTAQWQNQEYTGIEDVSNKGIPNGYAPLNSSALIPSEFLSSYVDDIVEGYLLAGVFYKEVTHTTAITGEEGKIYIDLTIGQSSKQYRWSGSVYNQITNGFIASTADVPDSTDKRYQTDAQQTNNDATSSIQTQIDSKQNALTYTPYKFIQVSQTPHTGTTAETILATDTILGGTFPSTEALKILFGINKTGTGGAYSIRIKINTSNTLSGATTIATFSAGSSTAQLSVLSRNFTLLGGNLYGYPFATSQINDVMNVGGTLGSTGYDTTSTIYVFWTATLVNSGDNITPNLASLTNN